MSGVEDSNNPGIQAGDDLLGYRIRRIVRISAIDTVFYEIEHRGTGARHVHLSNTDDENTFSVAFKTVPRDSTGVAHILEHTVLCGSKKYPVRDPFFSMLKRSLSTFMNAFTASDWTMYPFSTQNRKDFYNLMGVYLDAAFFPNIDRLSFKQEGHRLEFENGESGEQIEYKGVVYNEMRGAMSSPDQVLVRSLMNSLYPDTTYRFNSGGDPEAIPRLTHEQLVAFHKRHYHPSNAFFYTYGNLPLKDHLAFIQEKVLDNFRPIDPRTKVPGQPRWNRPRQVSYTYPAAQGEDLTRKYQACLAWLVTDIRDTFEVLVMTVLEQVLLGNAASPLRKALMDSELGSALSDGSGYDADNRDTLFASGLKDVDASAADKIETLVFDCLKRLVKDGIDKQLVESAIHQIEFHRREVTNVPYPYGLKLLLSFCGAWIHGGDPIRVLDLDGDLKRLRKALAEGRFLEDKIKRNFLQNPHRVRFTLVPDPDQTRRENERTAAELDEIQADLTPTEIERIIQDAASLKQLQEENEDTSVLPTLAIKDIPADVKRVAPSAVEAKIPATCYRQTTSGIQYFSAAAGVGSIPSDLIALAPFFCFALNKVGTKERDYTEMARRIDLYTGGIALAPQARTRFDLPGRLAAFIALNGKCLDRNKDHLYEIIGELTARFAFSNRVRLKQLLMEYRARLESAVIQNGHRLAISMASRNFSAASNLSETWTGIHQLKFIKETAERLDDKSLTALADRLETIAHSVFSPENMNVALIGENPAGASASSALIDMAQRFRLDKSGQMPPPPVSAGSGQPFDGWTTATAVSFVARAVPTVPMGHDDAPVLAVIAKLLRSLYLHREIREKGGAYGGFALYNSEDGMFGMASYRDPHIISTLDAFENALVFLNSGDYDGEDVKEAILQVCSEVDKPDPPGPGARKAFFRSLVGLTDEKRAQFKHRLLTVDNRQVRKAANKYFSRSASRPAFAVISNEERIEAANKKLGDRQLKVYRI